uniref:Uncharacterized protein n=1 Tax=Anopheles farauti TaxID=69004 RepID=A0A182Q1Y7_9DIPT
MAHLIANIGRQVPTRVSNDGHVGKQRGDQNQFTVGNEFNMPCATSCCSFASGTGHGSGSSTGPDTNTHVTEKHYGCYKAGVFFALAIIVLLLVGCLPVFLLTTNNNLILLILLVTLLLIGLATFVYFRWQRNRALAMRRTYEQQKFTLTRVHHPATVGCPPEGATVAGGKDIATATATTATSAGYSNSPTLPATAYYGQNGGAVAAGLTKADDPSEASTVIGPDPHVRNPYETTPTNQSTPSSVATTGPPESPWQAVAPGLPTQNVPSDGRSRQAVGGRKLQNTTCNTSGSVSSRSIFPKPITSVVSGCSWSDGSKLIVATVTPSSRKGSSTSASAMSYGPVFPSCTYRSCVTVRTMGLRWPSVSEPR